MSRRKGGMEREATSVDLGSEQMEEFRAAFNLFSGGQPKLTAAQLKNTLSKFNIRDARAEDMIKEADASGEGAIDFLAFSQMMSRKMAKSDTEEDLLDAFLKFDWRKTGMIPAAELSEALTNLGKPLSTRDLQEFMTVCEKDGQVHYNLFIKEMFGSKEGAK
eukprot:TRINITY_DN9031_c0_g1_i1.p1 TRINITY_DN9031_c0_g1~~TRINITY_DN9031_c0_g1_i1.p1  ORF type:complete len:162 (+),score=39.87 TRINITY_DN9031_c0_g1_i1:47-532(+)